MPRYLRAIQVPRGALISTQISIMIFFLNVEEAVVSGINIEQTSDIVMM